MKKVEEKKVESSGFHLHPMVIPSFLVGILVGLVFTQPFFNLRSSTPAFTGSSCYYSETKTDSGTNQELLVISDFGNNAVVGIRNFNSADKSIEPIRSYFSGKQTVAKNFGQDEDSGMVFNTIQTARVDGEYETRQMVMKMNDAGVIVGEGLMTNVRGTYFFENPVSVSFDSSPLLPVDCSSVPSSIK